MMNIKRISGFEDISEQAWDNLVVSSKTNYPFLRYGFQQAWWSHLGGGEWQNADLNIIIAEEDGQLAGIAPLFTTEVNSIKETRFIGGLEIADYLDFIVSADQSEDFIRQVLEMSTTDPTFFGGKIILDNIPDDSPTVAALKKNAEEDIWQIEIEKAYHTPAIPLADDWDAYLEGIDKKQRHEIRRKIRRAEGSEEDTVAWHIIDKEDNLDQAITDFIGLMGHDPGKAKFLTSAMRDQMDAIMRWAARAGILQLSFLTINGENAAGYLCFDDADRIWVYNSGFSPGFSYYSPGWVLLGYLIQHAINTGKTYFDFMRGDEKYKYKFGAEDSFVMKAILQRRGS